MDTELTVKQIQNRIVLYEGGCRVNLCIPNVSWGYFDTHEADLIIVTKSGYMTEYEIKRSYSDFLADFKKHTNHFENKVLKLYYVVPECIVDKCKEFLKNHEFAEPYRGHNKYSGNGICPLGLMEYNEEGYISTVIRAPQLNSYTGKNLQDYKLYIEERLKLASLGCMRFWDTKFNN